MTGLERYVAGWSPAEQRWTGQVTGWSVGAFADLLDQADPLRERPVVPPMWQVLGCLAHPAQSAIGTDGHPAEGPFLPPIPHRRRMFAGGRWREARPLPVDRPVECVARVVSVRVKTGRAGEMAFVTVRTEYRADGEPHVVEEQDLVYRSQPDPGQGGTGSGAPARPEVQPERQPPQQPEPSARPADRPAPLQQLSISPDQTLLFRFSALTYNAHRIHYDLPYATEVEGYPGLVVHGPLLTLLGLELPRRHRAERVTAVDYRLRRPAFAGAPLSAQALQGQQPGQLSLEVGVEGAPASMTATTGPALADLSG